MKRKLITTAKVCLLMFSITAFALFTAYTAAAQPTRDNSLLRVEVKSHEGEHVSVSVPVSILDTVYEVFPEELKTFCEDIEITPKAIIQALEELEGEDLLNIEGNDNVRVWLEPVTNDTRKELGFLKVNITKVEGDESETVVNLKIPRGLIQLIGIAADQFGIFDEIDLDLPKQIRTSN
jgi:hypothetical protein